MDELEDRTVRHGTFGCGFARFHQALHQHRLGSIDVCRSAICVQLVRDRPQGTNVELAHVERPDRVRILIWERGVGQTEASGTGACAAAVAAIVYERAARDLEVVSPGGSQRVEWTDGGLFLTGWAEVVFDGEFHVRPR